MKRSPRRPAVTRWSHERRRRYRMIQNEGPVHATFYPQSPFWLAISDEIDEPGNDNTLDEADIAARKEGR